jgi:plastocyanin
MRSRPAGVWQVKFTRAGTYCFVCTFHASSMTGLVEVTP